MRQTSVQHFECLLDFAAGSLIAGRFTGTQALLIDRARIFDVSLPGQETAEMIECGYITRVFDGNFSEVRDCLVLLSGLLQLEGQGIA